MKKKGTKGCFTGGEISMIADYASGLANNAVSAATYKFDPNKPAYTPDFMTGLKTGPVGMVSELVKFQKDKNQRSAYVASATPGNYATGGPIGYKRDYRMDQRPPFVEAPTYYANGGQMDTPLAANSFQVKGNPGTTDGNYYPQYNVNLDHNEVVKDKFVYSTKLKTPAGRSFSEEAMHIEKSTGKAQKLLKINPNDQMAKNTVKMNESSMASLAKLQETMATNMGLRQDKPQGLAYGGAYGGPGDPPYTYLGESATGLVNGKLGLSNMSAKTWLDITNPYDATTGKRRRAIGPDTFIGTSMQPGQAAIDLGRDGLFYDPYTKRFTVRNSKGEYVGVKPNAGEFDVQGPNIKDLRSGKAYNVDQHLQYMNSPRATAATPPPIDTPWHNTNPEYSTPKEQLGAFPYPTPATPPAPIVGGFTPPTGGKEGKKAAPASTPNPTAPYNSTESAYDRSVFEEMQAAGNTGDLPLYRGGGTPTLSALSSTTPARALPDFNKATTFGGGAADPTAAFAGMDQAFTIGDGLQALTVASKFGQLAGGPEVEKPYYDTTAITKENFDPSSSLYASNKNYQEGLNTLQNSSINQNRSFMNNLYANKLNQDSDILSKYNQMNQSARTQQETRQSDQRRYNIGQTVGTNDINARNRAAYKEAIDTAFNSLGNFGKGLNEKKTAYDSLAVLQKMYPDVYARIMAEQQKTKS